MHLLKIVEQKERAGGNDPSKVFKFSLEHRYQCLECLQVRYSLENDVSSFQLLVPINQNEINDNDEFTFEKCLNHNLKGSEIRRIRCSNCKTMTSFT